MKNTIHIDLIRRLLFFTEIICLNIECKFNGANTSDGSFFCRLKNITNDADGKCTEFIKKDK